MSARDDGGPAFGIADVRDADGVGITQGHPGMSLLDYFAGQALVGAIVGARGLGDMESGTRQKALSDVAELLYEIADAMIAARVK